MLASVHDVAPLEAAASFEPCDGHERTLGIMLCGVADSLQVTAERIAYGGDKQGRSRGVANSLQEEEQSAARLICGLTGTLQLQTMS